MEKENPLHIYVCEKMETQNKYTTTPLKYYRTGYMKKIRVKKNPLVFFRISGKNKLKKPMI